MLFFLDTANLKDIEYWADSGLISGVTTNPSLLSEKIGHNIPYHQHLADICQLIPYGSVSAEVIAMEEEGMLKEALKLADIAPNIAIKLPLTEAGLRVCHKLAQRDIKVNMTLCFNSLQALLAVRAGATYISLFCGRLDDAGHNSMDIISEVVRLCTHHNLSAKILAASIRTIDHVRQAALQGSHLITLPPALLGKLHEHPLTNSGLQKFVEDWQKTGQSLL